MPSLDRSHLIASLTENQVLGLTLWAEARNQPIEGIIAVANVIRNRVLADPASHGYSSVCTAPWQFSCWNESATDPNHSRLMSLAQSLITPTNSELPQNTQTDIPPAAKEALWIASGITSGSLYRDNTHGSKWYMTKTLYDVKRPKWAAYPPVAQIGDHVFFNRVG